MKTDKNKNQDKTLDKERDNPNLWELRKECWSNAINLVKESAILFENECYARAFMLSFTAMEEIGKYLLVCDFITGIVSLKELEEAFHSHHIKTAYFHNNVKIETKKRSGLFDSSILTMVYDKNKFKDFFELRNLSAYVNCDKNFKPISPDTQIGKELAEKMINKVTKEIDFIVFAEDLNGTIGSKALYK